MVLFIIKIKININKNCQKFKLIQKMNKLTEIYKLKRQKLNDEEQKMREIVKAQETQVDKIEKLKEEREPFWIYIRKPPVFDEPKIEEVFKERGIDQEYDITELGCGVEIFWPKRPWKKRNGTIKNATISTIQDLKTDFGTFKVWVEFNNYLSLEEINKIAELGCGCFYIDEVDAYEISFPPDNYKRKFLK